MTARRAALAGVVVLAALAATWTARVAYTPGAVAAKPAIARERVAREPAHDGTAWDPFAARHDASKPGSTDAERAFRAGEAYVARHRASIRRLYERRFGAELARTLALPIGEAWLELERRIERGEPGAAAALRELACLPPPPVPSSVMFDHITKGLEPRVAEFVRGALAREEAFVATDRDACTRHGLGDERLGELARRRWQSRGARVPAVDAPGPADGFAMFDAAYPESRVFRLVDGPLDPLVQAMLTGSNGIGEDLWVEMLAAAGLDASAAWAIGPCVVNPQNCTGFPALDAGQAAELLRASAEAGNMVALPRLVGQHEERGDLVAAYAWSLYWRWVAVSGCSPLPAAWDFADASRRIAEFESRLSPAGVATGRAEANRLIAAHGAQMRAAFACPP